MSSIRACEHAIWKRHVDEIGEDRALVYYGAALAATTGLTAGYWLADGRLADVLDPAGLAVCWPFFANCADFRVLPPWAVTVIAAGLLVCSCWNAWQFLQGRIRPAYGILMLLFVAKSLIIVQDFRLTLNHHYMAGWIIVVYLFLPGRRRALAWTLVAMYWWAGMLKLQPGSLWLSGAALYGRRPLGLPADWLPLACAYVVVLELFLVFGLLSTRSRLFWATFAQVLLFHVASFWVVGYFYPLLMGLLLSVLPLMRKIDADVRVAIGLAPTVLVIAIISGLQLPQFFLPGEAAVTGEARWFALNMFDAPIECRATFQRATEGIAPMLVQVPYLHPRTRCDPIVYWSAARDYCRAQGDVGDIDLRLESRKAGETRYRPVVTVRNFCATQPRYRLFGHNSWIRP